MNAADFVMALGRTSLEAGVLIVLVLAVQWAFRRHLTPQWNCALWLLVVLRLLPLSVGSPTSLFNLLPSWLAPGPVIAIPPRTNRADPAPPSATAGIFLTGKSTVTSEGALDRAANALGQPLQPAGSAVDIATVEVSPEESARGHWGRALLLIWLGGIVLLGGHVAWTSLALTRQLAALVPITDPTVLRLLRDCCDRVRLRRAPMLGESVDIDSPALHGFLRPRLLLPQGFVTRLSTHDLRFVFLHELAHVKRLDLPLNWTVTVLQVVHWFNPLVWIAFARWRSDREIACDGLAIAAAGPEAHHAYGRTILRLLESIAIPTSRPSLVGILESKRQLRRRMRMIAGYPGQGRPYVALAVVAALSVIGLTDAQTDPAAPAIPPARSTSSTTGSSQAPFVEWQGIMHGASVSVAYPVGWTTRAANPSVVFQSAAGDEVIAMTAGTMVEGNRQTGPRELKGAELVSALERFYERTPFPGEYSEHNFGRNLTPIVDFQFPVLEENGEVRGSLAAKFRKKELIRAQPFRAVFDYDGPAGQQGRMYFVPTAERMVAVTFIFKDPPPSGDRRAEHAAMMDHVVASIRTSAVSPRGTESAGVPAPTFHLPPPAVAAFGAVSGSPLALPGGPRLVAGRDALSGVNLNGQRVLFLVRASGSMLGETIEQATGRPGTGSERGRSLDETIRPPNQTDAERRNAPKWLRTLQILRWMLAALGPEQQFQILFFNDTTTPVLPSRSHAWIGTEDTVAAAEILARCAEIVPQGSANLERAVDSIALLPGLPDNIVLLTDGLPTSGDSIAVTGAVDEATRIRLFEKARKKLPSTVPVQTILLPLLEGDPGAPGIYWELANATRGALISPAKSWPALAEHPVAGDRPTPFGLPSGATHVAIVIDTSGSMRDPNRGGLWPIVIRKIGEVLDSHPHLQGLQLVDGDGRFILGRQGTGSAAWLPDSPVVREQIAQTLARYTQDSISNPVPGIGNALRFLHDPGNPDMRMACYIFGDEFIATADTVLRELDGLNPADESGRRKIVIHAVGFPTTIRFTFSMGQTGVKFANLMRLVTYQHGGAFIALQDL